MSDHHMRVTVEDDDLEYRIICTAAKNAPCRKNLHDVLVDIGMSTEDIDYWDEQYGEIYDAPSPWNQNCALVYYVDGMSDFGAYRDSPDSLNILELRCRKEGDIYVMDETGPHLLVLHAENEYLELLLDGKWVRDIPFKGAKRFSAPVDFGYNAEWESLYWKFSNDPTYYDLVDGKWVEA